MLEEFLPEDNGIVGFLGAFVSQPYTATSLLVLLLLI